MKYIEFGLGNTWIVRTETELPDGSEREQKGIIRPIRFRSFYVRIWFGRTVIIWDSREGIKRMKKARKARKFIIGIVSDLSESESQG